MILSAQTIRSLKILTPTKERTVLNGVTFGLSSCGYDIRLAEDVLMWPGKFFLGSSIEHFNMPNNVAARVHDKSTFIRRGLQVHNTFVEPGWRGYLTIELKNHWIHFIRLKRGTAIAQVVFELVDHPTEIPYDGKYQDQPKGAQPAIFEKLPTSPSKVFTMKQGPLKAPELNSHYDGETWSHGEIDQECPDTETLPPEWHEIRR